jgi:hypothetical protein
VGPSHRGVEREIDQRKKASMTMTTTGILTDMVLVESEKTATIHAPVERVDIADSQLNCEAPRKSRRGTL